jgi:phage gpG-like protein
MSNASNIPNFVQFAAEVKTEARRHAATESVKHFQQSFRDGGFTGASFEKWKDSRNPLRKTMYNDGTLMRSIHKVSAAGNKVVVESDTPYSALHNDGGTIVITEKMNSFFWAKYYEAAGIQKGSKSWGNIKSSEKRGSSALSKSNLNVVAKARFWKALALIKIGSKIKIPQRQYMGDSPIMMSNFDKFFIKLIETKQFTP